MEHAKAIAYCPDCGPATIPHWVERFTARMDRVFNFVLSPFEAIWRGILPAIAFMKPGRLVPAGARVLSAIGLAKIVTAPDDKVNWRTRVIWEEAQKRGIDMKEIRLFNMPREIFFATYKGDTRVFDGLPRPRLSNDSAQNWLDDKGIIIKKFATAGIPVPRGKSCTNFADAERMWRAIGGPVIVKPNLGSRSRHTYVHLNDVESLRHAFFKAKELSPYVVVEEELSGYVFRITLVDKRVAGIMRREPPHVFGDGTHTVRELVAVENKNPLRRGPIFHEILIDEEAVAYLATQKLSLDSVPRAGAMVVTNPKVSRAYGASTTEITDAHPENIKMFLKIAEVLNDPLVGVDFMIDDMARPWQDQKKCGVIECNSLPFIDLHHFPLKGPAINVAGLVWEMVFPGSGSRS